MAVARALTIAGSDSGGGAGIQADLKAFSARGVFGMSAITAITAQNTVGVTAVEAVSPDVVVAQIKAVMDDIPPDAVKIGMLGTSELIDAVAEGLAGYDGAVVLDPVMIAKSGDALLEDDAVAALVRLMLPKATVLTPNLPEAARMLGQTEAASPVEAEAQGRALLAMGPTSVLMKGGHGTGATCVDQLVTTDGVARIESPRISTRNTHGTGCTLSSAIAAELAKGTDVETSVRRSQAWLHRAIETSDALGIGSGHGPVHHFHEVWV